MKNIHLTEEGYKKLVEDLEFLKRTRRRELSKAIEEARAHGDISENAEYDAAKEAQALNELKVSELEDKLTRARVFDEEEIPKDKALIGATVRLKNLNSAEEMEYTLVSEVEVDCANGKISISSPVGRGLLGHKEDEIVEIKIPAGILKYKILKISR